VDKIFGIVCTLYINFLSSMLNREIAFSCEVNKPPLKERILDIRIMRCISRFLKVLFMERKQLF